MMPDNVGQILRVDAIWLSREPLDMRAGPETALARVIQAFGAARPHHAYVFANKRANRMKILVCDGFGLWLAARRLHHGKFVWTQLRQGDAVAIDEAQLQALVAGLPWQYAASDFVIDRQ
jgi:transposase